MIRNTAKILLTTALGVGVMGTASAETVKIGWTAWSDAEFVTKVARQVIEDNTDVDVTLTQTGIAPQYQGLTKGSIDVMLMSWQPSTHSDYIKKVEGDVFNLGLLYGNAKLGWAVPEYIPKDQLSSISDLNNDAVRSKLDGTITGIDPGAGLMRKSNQALEDYELSKYDLQSSSGAGMTAALERAVSNDDWIVVTAWNPHWMFGKYDLRYLEDPEGTMGKAERIHAVARNGFYQEHLKVAMILSRMQLPLDTLQSAMNDAQANSYEAAVDTFISEHSDLVDYWVTGRL